MLPGRKQRSLQPRSAPRDAEFLLRRAPYFSGSSTDSTTVHSTAEKNFRSIDVGMGQAHEALLMRQIPEEAECIIPCLYPLDLRYRRVDTVAKGLIDLAHECLTLADSTDIMVGLPPRRQTAGSPPWRT